MEPQFKVKNNHFILPEKIFEQNEQKFTVKEIEGNITVYSNTVVLILTQKNKVGSIIEGQCENWQFSEFGQEKIFETEIKFGPRENDYQELLCRGLVDILYDKQKLIEGLKENNITNIPESQLHSPYTGKTLTLMLGLDQVQEEIKGPYYRYIRSEVAKQFAKTILL